MFVAEVCNRGKTRICFIEPGAKIHSKYYMDDVLRLFPGRLLKKAVFDHDSDPSHASKPTQDWLRSATIRFIPKEDWMGNSLDMAPIDFCIGVALINRVKDGLATEERVNLLNALVDPPSQLLRSGVVGDHANSAI
ncbi:hypothetical protein BV898_16320 [Hypsibius exemplaris]|uniref:Uncharacterized protein n=1 Tax=Hypsibius exemplaris TaxID=2072580 RepID=A0A9X6RL03_HYPEX|nr:hypothetical protein BV898_16320 [Hypsibius exemplaris]